jgi:hypothetical protein
MCYNTNKKCSFLKYSTLSTYIIRANSMETVQTRVKTIQKEHHHDKANHQSSRVAMANQLTPPPGASAEGAD